MNCFERGIDFSAYISTNRGLIFHNCSNTDTNDSEFYQCYPRLRSSSDYAKVIPREKYCDEHSAPTCQRMGIIRPNYLGLHLFHVLTKLHTISYKNNFYKNTRGSFLVKFRRMTLGRGSPEKWILDSLRLAISYVILLKKSVQSIGWAQMEDFRKCSNISIYLVNRVHGDCV